MMPFINFLFLFCAYFICTVNDCCASVMKRTTYDLADVNYIKYTGLGALNSGVSNLMSIGLTLPGTGTGGTSPIPVQQQTYPITYSLGGGGIAIPAATANLQPQPGFLQNALGSYSGGGRPMPISHSISTNTSPDIQVPVSIPVQVPLPTTVMDTTLAMDSTGQLLSAHEEYLHVFGSNYNPAMASTHYGSDAYHGLSGETVQETVGAGGTQDTMGYLAGATSQLYNIATMGDQNQAWTNGFSEAAGMGNVVQHSNSNSNVINQRPSMHAVISDMI